MVMKRVLWICALGIIVLLGASAALFAQENSSPKEVKPEIEQMQKDFEWWPTDAKPAPVKDEERAGYWWWPSEPGEARPWGNRGFVYVYKIIYDYKSDELPPPQPEEQRAALLIKKIVKNVKIYFDYNKADLRQDGIKILEGAVGTLGRNPETSILITGNCDRRGSEAYNEKLGKKRGEIVKNYLLEKGITEDRIKIVSRGKLDAVAPITDIVGMQKERNAQFMIAEVEEVMMPYKGDTPDAAATKVEEGKFLIEKEEQVESEVQVSTREYVVKKGDTLSGIAKAELGAGHRWKYLYELNKDRIKDPNKLKAGQTIVIPVE